MQELKQEMRNGFEELKNRPQPITNTVSHH